jgi:cysteate synthase
MVDSWAADSRDFIVPDDETARNLAAGVNAKVLTNRRPPWGVRGGLYDALKAGGGDVVPVSNEEAESAGALFERLEGIDISQAAAVAVASIIKTVDDGRVNRDETIMLNITGGGTQRFRREFNVHGLEPSAVIPLDASDEEIVSVSVGLFENIGQ